MSNRIARKLLKMPIGNSLDNRISLIPGHMVGVTTRKRMYMLRSGLVDALDQDCASHGTIGNKQCPGISFERPAPIRNHVSHCSPSRFTAVSSGGSQRQMPATYSRDIYRIPISCVWRGSPVSLVTNTIVGGNSHILRAYSAPKTAVGVIPG